MRTQTILLAFVVFSASPAFAWINDVSAPTMAIAGESYQPTIKLLFENSCWSHLGTQVTSDGLIMNVDIETLFVGAVGDPCPGPSEDLWLNPEVVFPTSGSWTLHVVEHASVPPLGADEYTWDVQVEVSVRVATVNGSWSYVKALYR